jgi:hypothetical protein
MKIICRVWLSVFMIFTLACLSTTPATAEQCVVTEIQGTLVTLGCPGGVTTTENVGGIAETYRVGESIERGGGEQGRATGVDPRDVTNPSQRLTPNPNRR